jgi:hypothetical protein
MLTCEFFVSRNSTVRTDEARVRGGLNRKSLLFSFALCGRVYVCMCVPGNTREFLDPAPLGQAPVLGRRHERTGRGRPKRRIFVWR